VHVHLDMIDSTIKFWTECPKELAHYFAKKKSGIQILCDDKDEFLKNHQTSNFHKFWFADNINGIEHAVCIIGFETSDAFDEINKENQEFWDSILCVSDLTADSFEFKDAFELCETEQQKKSLYILEQFNKNRNSTLPYTTQQTVNILKNAIEDLISLHTITKSIKYLLVRSIYVCNNEIHLSLNNITDKKDRQEKLFDLCIPEEECINFWIETTWYHTNKLCRECGGIAFNRDKANLFFEDGMIDDNLKRWYKQYGIYNCCYSRRVYDEFENSDRCVIGFYSLNKFNEFVELKNKDSENVISDVKFSFCDTTELKYAANVVIDLCYDWSECGIMTEAEYQHFSKYIDVLFPLYENLLQSGLSTEEFFEFQDYLCDAISIITHIVVMKLHLLGEKVGKIQRKYRDISDDIID